jgi:hypothetical protein
MTEEQKLWLKQSTKRILELPQLIADVMKETNHKSEMEELKQFLDGRELSLKTELSFELDAETGKKKYPNEASRSARAIELMDKQDDVVACRKQLAELEANKFNAGIKVEQLRNELASLKAVLSVFASNINVEAEQIRAESIMKSNETKTVKVEVVHVTR